MLVKLVKKKNLACYQKKGEGFAEELNKKIHSYFHDLKNDTLAACWRPRQCAGFWDNYSIQVLKKEPNLFY